MKISLSQILLAATMLVAGAVTLYADQLDDYFLLILTYVGINITLAVSLNLVTGYTGQFSLGHAGFMAVGGYTSAVVSYYGGATVLKGVLAIPYAGQQIVFVLALLCGGLAAALAGLLVGIPSLRLRGDYLAIVTLGFGEIIRVLIQNCDFLGASRGFQGVPAYTNIFWTFTVAAITIYVVNNLVTSTYGRGFLATRDDEVAAEAMGINTTKYKVNAFVIGAFFAGVAGGLFGHATQFLSPDGFNFLKSVEIVTMVILGGLGSMFGVVLAAIVITLLNEWLRSFETFRMIIFSLLLIILMILRPQGLLGGFEEWFKRFFQRKKASQT